MMNVRVLASLLILAGACGSDEGDDKTLSAPLVSGLSINEVSLFQGLKASLMKDGAPASSPNVPIIAGRPGLLRVHVKPASGYVPHEVVVRVDFTQNGAALPALEQRVTITNASSEANLLSTVNFDIPAATMTPDVTFAVSIHEATMGEAGPDTAGAQYPATGQALMGVVVSGTVKITLLPVVYSADGSNRTPPMDEAYVQSFRTRMMALYPVSDVEVTVGENFAWDQPIDADGTGWDELLTSVLTKRMRDGAAANQYYYGLFAPSSSFGKYCGHGCVTGLSTLGQRVSDDWARASIGISYVGSEADAAGTFVHEVGHAHGREHAPCDTGDADRRYPYDDGEIGVYGYDAASKKLLDPKGTARDMMGYCSPVWISDYTYKALFDRIVGISRQPNRKLVEQTWHTVLVNDSGAHRSEVVTVDRQPGGEDKIIERTVGGKTELVTAQFYPFDHLPGGILLVPESEDTGTLRVDGKLIR